MHTDHFVFVKSSYRIWSDQGFTVYVKIKIADKSVDFKKMLYTDLIVSGQTHKLLSS